MKKPNRFLCFVCFLFVVIFTFSIAAPIGEILRLEGDFLVGYDDIETANKCKTFGNFVFAKLNESQKMVGGEKSKQGEVVFKLFGFLPIKKIDVEIVDDDEYFVGGMPVGISICTEGAIVVNEEIVDGVTFKEGDILTKINGQEITRICDISQILENSVEEVEVEYIRKNKPIKALVKTKYGEDGSRKLGLWVKDDVTGIGTLTFVNKNTKRYAALGHPIVDADGGNIVPVSSGDLFECNLIGINKGKRNNPGELRCVFSSFNSKGSIESNSKFGITGVLQETSRLVDENQCAKLGGRLGVKMGEAKIVSNISGIKEEYDIEIIKANYQKSADDKSIVFRVKDKRLLELTGGIVQGMSGSPIMQNGKIVGAVTHVFLTDPTKGYGVYVDWMLDNVD